MSHCIALLPRTDFMSDHSRLTFIKDCTGVSLTHLSPELFEQVFVKAEIVFRTSIKDHSKNIVKWMCDTCIRDISVSLPECHSLLKRLLIKIFTLGTHHHVKLLSSSKNNASRSSKTSTRHDTYQ